MTESRSYPTVSSRSWHFHLFDSSQISELLPFLIALIAAGSAAGLLAGIFGIGGGAILVPVFYQMLGTLGVDDAVRMHISVGTSLAVIMPTSIRSFLGHKARGVVDMELLKSFVIAVPAGVIMASIAAAFLSSASLRFIFALFALLIGLKLLFMRENTRLSRDIPRGPIRYLVGWFIGFFSTFMGIGGGILNNTFMTLFGRPIHQAVGTSAGVGVLISIPGMLGYVWAGWGLENLPDWSLGFVNLLLMAVVIPVTWLLAPVGVKIAHALSKHQLEICCGVFLVLVSVRFIVSLI